jgi:hypothetical protein
MKTELDYQHLGKTIAESLKDYGMVCRKEKADQFYFVYKVNDTFEEGFISHNEIVEFLNGDTGYTKSEIMDFLKNIAKTSFMEFVELPILEKVYKLSKHFGVETILGKSIAHLSYQTALSIVEND